MTFNLGDAIRKVRAVEARIKQEEDAFEEKLKEFKDYAKAKRAEILSHLLATGQKKRQHRVRHGVLEREGDVPSA